MPEATTIPTLTSDTSENLTAAARRAESWFGEPFLMPDEDPSQALASGTARRAALDDALAEMDAGREAPSSRWKVRYGLMLAELIAATQRPVEENGNGNGHATNGPPPDADADEDAYDDFDAGYIEDELVE